MCGIVGVLAEKNAASMAFAALKRLEYRGYDSWGVAFKGGKSIEVLKKTGKLPESFSFQAGSGTALAHTRWATHGKVTEANAHPHLSNDKTIAVVHNGIIENHEELKHFLEGKGFSFNSETDTEIIPNLIQLFMGEGQSFKEAVRLSLKKIDGSYAVVAMHAGERELVAARNGSPLVIGLGKHSIFAASDVPAFLDHAKKVVYLNDFEMALLGKKAEFFDVLTGKQLEKDVEEVNWSIEQAQKGEFPHFMLKELNEQRFTIKKAVQQPKGIIEKVSSMIKNAKGVFFVGCGTSYHACVSSAYIFSHVAKMHVNVVLASEFRNYEEFLEKETLVIAVSQSGETADVLDAVKTAKKRSSKVVSIVNVMGSSLTRLSDETIMMNSGPEICVLSTKSYTSQLAILLLLAYVVAGKQVEGHELVEKAAALSQKVIDESSAPAKELAARLKNSRDFFLIGRDLAFPSALEGALKIKEVSYIHAEGFAGAELKHGTIALVEEGIPCIVFSTDQTRPLIMSNAQELKSRGAFIIGIDSKPNKLFDYFFRVEEVGNANPVLMILPIQLLAYHLAVEKKLDPDKPRNLAKSVTVK